MKGTVNSTLSEGDHQYFRFQNKKIPKLIPYVLVFIQIYKNSVKRIKELDTINVQPVRYICEFESSINFTFVKLILSTY